MVTVSEATSIIFSQQMRPRVAKVDLLDALNRSLAEPVVADRDFPPFNRVSMDGIGIRYEEWKEGRRSFPVEGTQAAGEPQKTLGNPSHCMEVMTGAVVPLGIDTVIRYEDVEVTSGIATILVDSIEQGQSIHVQGSDVRKGEQILSPGQLLAPSELALLAAVGKAKVSVFEFPRVAIISTGDELVDIEEAPEPWQIRRSNSYALQSALRKLGVEGVRFHLEDEPSSMRTKMSEIVNDFEVLILSGGVSKGKFDFVPAVLKDVGIDPLFHQVSQRPGKPFWFGRSAAGKVA
ncbi:MAG: molybdopterin molybdotransferase MoeA, partial [Bacteroidota bacterium]|nr:molybdopterin molybdotransferase MoeA [Bacteroidota bacterium]